jgi:threonine aldolase
MARLIDLRSDTVTQPTQAMRDAMRDAEVGDDILGEDPTVRELERRSAEILGKEAGLFVVSGTMANQVAVMAFTERGDEIIVGEDTHIYNLEVGGLAALSQVQVRTLLATRGEFSLDAVRAAIRPRGIQSPVTRLLCLEDTFNLNRGIPLGPEYLRAVGRVARERGVAVYLDGARVFNAAVALNVPAADLAAAADAAMFCVAKGLSAPVGSVVVGSREFIEKARWIRQRVGGGMRQAGHMAAAALLGITEMVGRLADDHRNARSLAEGLARIDRSLVDLETPMTNIVLMDFRAAGLTGAEVARRLAELGIRVKVVAEYQARAVTHHGVDAADVDAVVSAVRRCLGPATRAARG